jgi:hypothetical protein
MIEFHKEELSEQDFLEAANSIFSAEQKDFERIKSEKWYQALFHAITLNQDGKKYAVRGVRNLAQLQQLFIQFYVEHYRQTSDYLDAIMDSVMKNSTSIKALYGKLMLKLERQEGPESLSVEDAEILALLLCEYRDENGTVSERVQKYNRGVLSVLPCKIPSGSLNLHQISLLKSPKIVYRCFMEQCAVDETIDTKSWPVELRELLKDFELSDNTKMSIQDAVKREVEIAGIDYLLEKYGDIDSDIPDTAFVVYDEDESARYRDEEKQGGSRNDLNIFQSQMIFNRITGLLPAHLWETLERCEIRVEYLTQSINDSTNVMDGIDLVQGFKLSYHADSTTEALCWIFVIFTMNDLFICDEDGKVADIPLHSLLSAIENADELEIRAGKIDLYDNNGNVMEGSNKISIPRNRFNRYLIRDLRKSLECFIDEYGGFRPSVDYQIKKTVEQYIGQISKSSPVYLFTEIVENKKQKKQEKLLNNALQKYARRVQVRDVIGFIDTSLFGNGSDGLLFSTDGISFDYAFEKVFIHYDEINRIDFNAKRKSLMFYGNFSERKKDDSVPVIDNIFFNLVPLKQCIEEILYVI